MCDATVGFAVLASMFDAVVRAKKGPLKRKHVRTFLDHVYKDHEFFSALRLMLPNLDKERGNYGLKEAVLAKSLAEALCLSKDSEDAQKLLNWRKGGTRAGSNAGNFAFIATEILSRRQRVSSLGIKIKDVNDLLDRLGAAERREEKVAVLGEMINKTNAQEMRWIIMIILKELKLGISEKAIFNEFHPDAEDLFNVTCDLKLVCEKLRNRNERFERQDIEVGKAVRPQLAGRAANAEEAWRKLRGKQVLVECKFDGDRIQIHKNGSSVNFFSRNFIDHQEYKEGMADLIIQNVLADKCILDGEMLVWDRSTQRFVDFGTNREAAKAAKDGLDTSQQLCYVAFDILYHGNSSVIHLPLRERHQLLEKSVKPLQGRLELLLPKGSSNLQPSEGDPKWSSIATRLEDVETFFRQTVENRDEGIIMKDLDSNWEPTDRSAKWLKLKPDYVQVGSDLDVLIIGGYYGSGRRGGQVAQFLLGVAEPPKTGEYPTRFLSFCKVGTGLTDEESDHLVQKLKPYFRRYEKNTKPPSCYIVTNAAKERPDVWIDQPDKSVILEITSDIRTIKTEVFAAPYGLRFPRIHKVRYEKPWYDCLDVQTLVNMVHSPSGTTSDTKQPDGKRNNAKKRQKKVEARCMPLIPFHMSVTDVSGVKRATHIFDGLVFYFTNFSEEYSRGNLHKMVLENGGTFSMNLNDDVTHALACDRKGIKYMAAASHSDVIHYSWITDCCAAKRLLPIRPKHFLHLSAKTKEKLKADFDEYGDYYFVEIDTHDLRQLFENIEPAKVATDEAELTHYKKKYCPSATLCRFSSCNIYFHKPIHSRNIDSQVVAETTLMRQKLEVGMHAGVVTDSLSGDVTHMIVYTSPNQSLSFRSIFKSVSPSDRRLLMSDKLKILSHQWIDDHMPDTCGHPSEVKYDLRDASFQYNESEMDAEKPTTPAEKEEDERITNRIELGSAASIGVDEGTIPTVGMPRTRLVTLPKVSRSAKRRNPGHHIKEERPVNLDPFKRNIDHRIKEDKLVNLDIFKRKRPKTQEVKVEASSSVLPTTEPAPEINRIASTSEVTAVPSTIRNLAAGESSCDGESATENSLKDFLGDLIPTYSISQLPSVQKNSSQEIPAASGTNLILSSPAKTPVDDLPLLDQTSSRAVENAKDHTGVPGKIANKKKVSYKNLVSSLLNPP